MNLYLFNRVFFQISGILDEIVSPFPNSYLYNFRLSTEKTTFNIITY